MFPPRNLTDLIARQHYAEYLKGDREALILLVAHCVVRGLKVPEDAAADYADGIRRWKELEVRTLNEALNIDGRKGLRLADQRKRDKWASCLYMHVEEMREQGHPIDRGTFEAVGKEYGYSASAARDIYYEIKFQMSNTDEFRKGREELMALIAESKTYK